jgi:hypothetical protein
MRQRYEAAVRAAQNSTAARSADRSSSHDHKSQSEGNDYDYQKQSQVRGFPASSIGLDKIALYWSMPTGLGGSTGGPGVDDSLSRACERT